MGVMKLVLPVVGLLAGAGAGIGAALFLAEPETEGAGAPEDDAAGAEVSAAAQDEDDPDSAPVFAELSNQFVVPVVRNGSVRALIVMSITLEVAEGETEAVFAIEPRLRDAFLQVLFDHANTGGFDDNFTQAERMTILRQGLKETAQRLLGKAVRDVLIVDIVRQEV